MVFLMFMAYKYIINNFFMIILNFFFLPQIIHNSIKGQQTIPNNYYLYSLMACRTILPVNDII